jgi:hypothetical protein
VRWVGEHELEFATGGTTPYHRNDPCLTPPVPRLMEGAPPSTTAHPAEAAGAKPQVLASSATPPSDGTKDPGRREGPAP